MNPSQVAYYEGEPLYYYEPMHRLAAVLGQWDAFTWSMVILIVCMVVWIVTRGDQ